MSDMSCRRFRNTRSDLSDCLAALRAGDTLGADEARAGRQMFEEFLDCRRETGSTTDYDDDGIEALFDDRTKKGDYGK